MNDTDEQLQIRTLPDLEWAALNKQAVYVPQSPAAWGKPKPAAFIMNLQGWVILRLLRAGMFVYRKKKQ